MIKVAFLLLFFFTCRSQAVPVLNENAAASQEITVLPDHADPKVFYVAPTVMTVCADEKGVPRFSWQDLETKSGLHAIVQMTLCARFDDQLLQIAKANILARVPEARFVALPAASSRVVFSPVLSPYIAAQFCDHAAGSVGDEQACALHLNVRGRQVFLKNIRERVTMTLQYAYTVNGFSKNPDGSYASAPSPFEVAIRVGGEALHEHPELFRDRHGEALPSRK